MQVGVSEVGAFFVASWLRFIVRAVLRMALQAIALMRLAAVWSWGRRRARMTVSIGER